MNRYLAVAVAALGVFLPGPAYALTCATPRVDEAVIDAAVAIFEGTAGPGRAVQSSETGTITERELDRLEVNLENLRVYPFAITRNWKGAVAGQSIKVLLDTYWGDRFAEGQTYLVFSFGKVGEFYVAPLCGLSFWINPERKIKHIDTLEQVLGGGGN